jgi:hypothetical protein
LFAPRQAPTERVRKEREMAKLRAGIGFSSVIAVIVATGVIFQHNRAVAIAVELLGFVGIAVGLLIGSKRRQGKKQDRR